MSNILPNIKERILYLAENVEDSKQEFFRKIDITYGNFTGDKKKRPVNSDAIENILRIYPQTNPEWLTIGKGSMLKVDSPVVAEPGSTYSKQLRNHLIPLYDGVVTAGMQESAMLESTSEPAEMIDAGDWFRDATAAMRVHGDSMHPEYRSGSIAALREVINKRLVVYGQDYLIETSEYRVIKRLQRSDQSESWLACSVNEERYVSSGRLIHESFDIHIDDVLRLYQVLGSVKRTQSSTVINANKPRNKK